MVMTAAAVVGAAVALVIVAFALRAARRRLLAAIDRLPAAVRAQAGADSARRRPLDELEAIAGELAAQAQASSFVADALAPFPESGARGVESSPTSEEVAVLAVELRRLVDRARGSGAGPIERHSRDLAVIDRIVVDHGGQVAGVLGHRVLAAFRGEERTLCAVSAAAAVIGRVAAAGSAASIETPHVAVASGEAWSGSVDYRGRAESALIGPPLQRIERLLHDAIPGEILLARNAYEEIERDLERIGETAVRRAGTVGAQEAYVLAADAGARLRLPLRAMQTGGEPEPVRVEASPSRRTPAARRAVGDLFAGRFELNERLGGGAGSDAWKARDAAGRWFVVKRLYDGTAEDGAIAAAWLAAQRASAAIDDAWVVGVIAADSCDDGLYAARAYARDQTLRSVLGAGVRPPRGVALSWVRQLAAGLTAIHAAGLVHASPRAENVVVDRCGVARWIDLGVTRGRLRRSGGPEIPPEWSEKGPSASTDIFGLGALLDEMLLGPAHGAGTVSAEDDALRHVVHACLLEDPLLRYPSAAALLAALNRLPPPA